MHVAVAGAMGRMGTVAREALQRSGEYLCGLSRHALPEHDVVDSLDAVLARKPDVLLDLTTQPASFDISLLAARHGLPVVVGASGWNDDQRGALAQAVRERGIGALIVPNFSLGAVLMMRLASEAARTFPHAEIVELHHPGKKDKPSGTALETAARIERAGGERPGIHSLRLPGSVAHQEVVFGGDGELLTIRHDTLSRTSFVAGMLLAVRGVTRLRGLSVGLEAVIE